MRAEWITTRLGEITTKIGSGATPLGGEGAYKESGICLFRSLNVHDWGFKEAKLAHIDDVQASRLSNVVVEANDVLLNITGASVARCCLAPLEFLPARVNQHVSIIRPATGRLLSAFLHYLLISKIYKDRLLHTGEEGGSTRQAITKAQIQAFIIGYPASLAEQQRIVAILDEAFDAIATAKTNAEKNLQNARAVFESHLHSVFAQAWKSEELVPLSELATDITDGDHLPPPKSETGVPFITIGNIQKETSTIDFTDTFMVPHEYFNRLNANKRPKRSDVLYTVTGSFGIPVMVRDDGKFCFQRHIGLIRPRAEIQTEWLYYLLSSSQVFTQATERATGTAQKTVSLQVLRSLQVPRVSPPQQCSAVIKLDALRAQTQRLESIYRRKLAALDALKKSLLDQAFTGKL